ncbi:prolactin [Tupaia chinensis]|nr:prolactin [Tupaia chinensis]
MSGCPRGSTNCQLSLTELFNRAGLIAQKFQTAAMDLYNEFHQQYSGEQGFLSQGIVPCHTALIPSPVTKEQAQSYTNEQLLGTCLSILRSWEEPLSHVLTEARKLPRVSRVILSKIEDVEAQNMHLLQGVQKIMEQVRPGSVAENQAYSTWSGLQRLKSTSQDTRLHGFHVECRCVRRDANKVNNLLNIVKCRMDPSGGC